MAVGSTALNLGTGVGHSVKEIVRAVEAVTGQLVITPFVASAG